MKYEHLPEGWRQVRLKSVTKEIKQRNSNHAFTVTDVLGVSNKIGFYPNDREIKDDVSRYKVITHRDFGYNPMRLNIGSLAYRDRPESGLISPDYVAFRCDTNQLLPEYFNYFRQTSVWWHQIENGGQGSVRIRYYYSDIANFTIPLPPVDEQCRIAEVLRDADANITHVEAQIEAAQQLKRGVMQRLFMYGLAGVGTPTKHTWIGKIPEAWDVVKLSEIIDELLSGQHVEAEYCNEAGIGTPYFTGPNDFWDGSTVVTKYTEKPKVVCEKGDILITVKGDGCGKLAYSSTDAAISRQLMAIKISNTFARQICFQWLEQQQTLLKNISSGTIPGLSRDQILNLLIPSIPFEEQHEIAAILSDHDITIRSLRAEEESLREVKRGLMQKLLSGQVRV